MAHAAHVWTHAFGLLASPLSCALPPSVCMTPGLLQHANRRDLHLRQRRAVVVVHRQVVQSREQLHARLVDDLPDHQPLAVQLRVGARRERELKGAAAAADGQQARLVVADGVGRVVVERRPHGEADGLRPPRDEAERAALLRELAQHDGLVAHDARDAA
eukprot:CAMPEP_0182830620 /NCGR_PEP_ID=MMETSP0006_2-20121128/18676_1 /TAXON_ID=97485 /ORGANISM="Prymnesium parvum, Strain Texoma1" /LENGTH=159 /DNA_ID=CAMNT_0024958207 /DNA_START=151 /DNA_END=627 /DNA_ORIENTATION=+